MRAHALRNSTKFVVRKHVYHIDKVSPNIHASVVMQMTTTTVRAIHTGNSFLYFPAVHLQSFHLVKRPQDKHCGQSNCKKDIKLT